MQDLAHRLLGRKKLLSYATNCALQETKVLMGGEKINVPLLSLSIYSTIAKSLSGTVLATRRGAMFLIYTKFNLGYWPARSF